MNIAFIPVRGGSKSIPLKNIKDLCGKPLVYWNVEALQQSETIDKIIVATDHAAIKDTVNSFGFSKVEVYDRDAKNAQDTSSTEAVMLEYLHKNASNFNPTDNFMLVQATSPLTETNHIDEAFVKMAETGADSLLSCVRTHHFFWSEDGQPRNYDFMNRPRRQDWDGWMMENGALYINSIANILKDENRMSGKVCVYEMPEHTATEIDEPDDWIIIEKLMNKYRIVNAKPAILSSIKVNKKSKPELMKTA